MAISRVLDEYRNQGQNFLLKVFESAKHLEDVTGITNYNELDGDIINYNESDLETSSDDD